MTGGNKVSYTYAKGALTTITDTQSRTITFGYTDPNNATQASTVTDNSLNRTINLTYAGPQGALSKVVDATGAQTLFAYNPTSGKLSSVTDARGDVTAFAYDSGLRLSTMTAARRVAPTPHRGCGHWDTHPPRPRRGKTRTATPPRTPSPRSVGRESPR